MKSSEDNTKMHEFTIRVIMKSEGICNFCRKAISSNAIKKHLLSCIERKKMNELKKGNDKIFMIKAGAGPFWVYFELSSLKSLRDIDVFLRDLWLECCGHLSMFTMGENTYAIEPQKEHGDKSMNIRLEDAHFYEGMKFKHEYDFGTTTELFLECISERKGIVEPKIIILARNNLPEFKCKCGNVAKEICSDCVYDGSGFLCEKCAKTHECGEEMLLPVVNSPRMGMCGYTSGDVEEDEY